MYGLKRAKKFIIVEAIDSLPAMSSMRGIDTIRYNTFAQL